MNLPDAIVDGALRLGLGKFTTSTEIEQASEILTRVGCMTIS
jgi:cysteine desulfurase